MPTVSDNFDGEEWDKAVYGESAEIRAIRAAGTAWDDPDLFNDGSIPSDVRAELIQLRAVVEGLAAQQAAVHSFGAQLWTEIQPLLEHVKPMLDEIQGSYLYRAFVAKRGKR